MDKILWPGWETVRLIGRGSFGAVYEIERDMFGEKEKAALKVITIPQNEGDIAEMRSDGYDDESITSTFQSHLKSIVAEYSLMRKMNGYSNVVNCDDVRYIQHDDGIGWDIFIKMELLKPLVDALPRQITEDTVLRIGTDICKALVLCRKYDIVHRDIKPQNIFVSPNGDYKLGDFGIAKTVEKTSGGTKIGTYKYMAPEVYNNQPYGAAADIYSLGLVLYWLLNERRMPFLPLPPAKLSAGMDEDARLRRLRGEAIPAPKNGSKELKRIVLKACAYDPADRYHTADEMLEDLNSLLFGTAKKEPVITLTPVAPKATEPEAPADTTQKDTSAEQAEETEMTEQTAGVWEKEEETVTESEDEEDETVGVFRGNGSTVKSDTGAAGKTEKELAESRPENPGEEGTKKPWLSILAAVLLICLGFGVYGYFNCWYGHTWIEASCTAARSCIRCGKEEGTPLGHNWIDASCSAPKTCKVCGAEDGIPLMHDWENPLSDTTYCRYCGINRYRMMAFEDSGPDSNLIWGQDAYSRADIYEINFVRTDFADVPDSAWDLSAARNRSILAWVDDGTLTVASDGVIAANEDSSELFYYFSSVRSIQFNDCFDTSDVTNMHGMFFGCSSLTQLDLSGFDTSKVTDMGWMFDNCRKLSQLDLSGFDTSKATDMGGMFGDCRSLTQLDLSGFDTSKVTDMGLMFAGCSSLTQLDLSNFATSKVTNMRYMFYDCTSLTHLDLSNFDTSKVTDMRFMFAECRYLAQLDLTGFDTSKVTDMGYMFNYCVALRQNGLICNDSEIRAVFDQRN